MNTKRLRTRMHPSLHTVIFLISALLLVGCSKPIDKAIVGKWEDDSKAGAFLEFFHDNTFIMSNGNLQHSGRWTKVSDDRIKADITILGITVTKVFENIEISGNEMKFTLDGDEGNFTRKK